MRLRGSKNVQGFYKRTLDISHGFTTALCLVLEPISVFLIKTGESSSPVQWSSPVNSDTHISGGVENLRF